MLTWLRGPRLLITGLTATGVFLAAVGLSLYLPETPGEGSPPETLETAGYVDTEACLPCHANIYETYQHTGMGRSFFRPRPERMIEDWSGKRIFHHPASDRYYTMYERNGRYYQRRHQIGFDGKETNVIEKEIHFVMGSRNHARTYLHQTADGKIVELPVAWYSEKGGFWAMNPGYDRPDHEDFRRRVTYTCMFCHNAYPQVEPGEDTFGRDSVFTKGLPEGIDCQRCHGPGRDHIRAVQTPGGTLEEVRRSIVNPARLSPQRQLEVCMQCHLETTSARLPNFIRRYERSAFSFRPGQTLGDYILHFDHAPGTGHDDKFEIVSAAYRLRMSACFQESNGAMTCITCHDPHDIPRGEEAVRHYVSVCGGCHGAALQNLIASNRHPASPDCLDCHMPKRRTDDVIHVVMTDHYIQRLRPRRDLIAPLQEQHRKYEGDVVLYYPSDLTDAPQKELYLAVAQVKENANVKEGILRLERSIQRYQPERAEFYFELGEAYFEDRRMNRAIAMYEEALRRKADLWPALRKLGVALGNSGQLARAAEVLEKAAGMGTAEVIALNDLALIYRQQGNLTEAVKMLEEAMERDPDSPEAHNNLGGALLELGNRKAAETAFRNAIRLQPDLATAHHNLANLLAAGEDFPQAQFHFERAIQNGPDYAPARHDYGLVLAQMQLFEKAEAQLETALRLRPEWAEAHLGLANVLAVLGRFGEALLHFQEAAKSANPAVRQEALKSIEKLGREQ